MNETSLEGPSAHGGCVNYNVAKSSARVYTALPRSRGGFWGLRSVIWGYRAPCVSSSGLTLKAPGPRT